MAAATAALVLGTARGAAAQPAAADSEPTLSAAYYDADSLQVSWTGHWSGYHIVHCDASPGGSCDPDRGDAANHIGHISAITYSGDGVWNKCSGNYGSDGSDATDFSCILDGLTADSTHCYKVGDLSQNIPTAFSNIGCATVTAP